MLTNVERPRISVSHVYAWGVHLYTGMGLVVAGAIAYVLVSDDPWRFRDAFLLMAVGILIDATDGWFARRVRVKEVLPGFDGRRLDDLVDFLTYTFLPLFLIWRARADLLPPGQEWCLLVPLLASAYGFCQVDAKTPDGFFLGFPSYWNLVAFYLYVLRLPGWFAVGVLVGLALLTFVPARYLYPTQRGPLSRLTNLLGGVWTMLLVAILWRLPADPAGDDVTRGLALVSLFFPIYYLAASWVITVRWLMARLVARRA